MKFGKFLAEKKQNLPVEWAENCINYDYLKKFLKAKTEPASVNSSLISQSAILAGTDDSETRHLSQILADRLLQLSKATPEFLESLDADVLKLNSFFNSTVASLQTRQDASDSAESEKILQDVLRLERFIFLNYTGISKILKKHDKLSGIKVSEMFLSRVSNFDFYKSVGLIQLKKALMEAASGGAPANPVAIQDSMASANSASSSSFNLGSSAALVSSSGSLLPNHPNLWFPPAAILPSQKLIITMSGPHGTDILGAILESLSSYNVPIEDLMFSRVYHNVTCACLVRLSADHVVIFQDLASRARKWESELRFEVYDELDQLPKNLQDAPYRNRQKYTATIMNQNTLSAQFLSLWTKMLLKYRISVEAMRRLNEGQLCVVEMKLSVPNDVEIDLFRAELFQLSSEKGSDVALQPDDVYRRSKRLVIMDMDSTLIQQEVIDELAKHVGVVSEVAKITHKAMNGEIDFQESLKQRVSLLKGAPITILDSVRQILTFTEGAHFLCSALKKLGYKLAVISGGFIPLASYVKNELGLDYAFANQLKVSPNGMTLTGETVGPVVDGERKAELLEVIAQAEGIGPEQVIAIGDGANDLFMLAAAGLGIAFNAKPKARTRINQKSLKNVLYLLGYSDEDIKQLVESK